MGTEKRDRQKANRDAKRAAEQAALARQQRNRLIRNALILTAVIIVAGLLLTLTGCGNNTSNNDDAFQAVDAGAQPSDDPASTEPALDGTAPAKTVAPSGPATYGTGACAPVDGVDTPVIEFQAAPKKCIDPAKTYTATVVTTEGTVTVKLDTAKTPVTTNNFVNLARYGFYDGTDIFRTEAGSGILQGGSPATQSNSDPGPGYTIPDEKLPFTADDYGPGTLAMARTSAPNSGGGQFFLLASEGGRYLGDPNQGSSAGSYVVFGKTTAGLDVLAKIAALDNGQSAPSKKVAITKVTITES